MTARSVTEDSGRAIAAPRRDFLVVATGALVAIGGGGAAWWLVDSMNPSADVLAVSSTTVDLAPIAPGQRITVIWRGKPVFVWHRTEAVIAAARDVAIADLPDPQADGARAQRPEWLIVVGVCTHLGCVPLGQRPSDAHGDFGGWFCPCHGSQYDTSGRIRRGPAPANLAVPPYRFVTATTIEIG